MSINKLSYPQVLRLTLILLFGLFFNFSVSAQQEEVTVDTAIFEPEPEFVPDEPVEEGSEYFSPKSMESPAMTPIEWREIPDSVKNNLKQNEDFWYVSQRSKEARKESVQTTRSFSESKTFQTILWFIVILGFAAFIMMYLTNSNVRLFRRTNQRFNIDDEDVDTDDIFAINYNREIEKAAGAGNYRLAIRLMFLRLLKNLSEKNIIQYKHDRTNFDYLLQLVSTKYYNDFFRLTRNYEYSWYGQFPVSEEAYKVIKKEYERFDPGMNKI